MPEFPIQTPEPAFTRGTDPAPPGGMLDLILVVSAVAFFGISWAYVRFCERIAGSP